LVILTRPARQGRRFAASLRRAMPGGLRVMVAPLMDEVLLAPPLRLDGRAVIFTSETAVHAALRLIPPGQRGTAHCVGPRTAAVARRAGFAVALHGGDADALVAALAHPGPPLIHLRGRDTRGDIAARLTRAGRDTAEAVVYGQEARPLPARARAALADETSPVLVAVFSPRSARLLRQAVPDLRDTVTLAAFSPAVATELGNFPRVLVADRPDGPAMAGLIVAWAQEMRLTRRNGPPADETACPAPWNQSHE
jgi:uroporphyrinogen-III synthase